MCLHIKAQLLVSRAWHGPIWRLEGSREGCLSVVDGNQLHAGLTALKGHRKASSWAPPSQLHPLWVLPQKAMKCSYFLSESHQSTGRTAVKNCTALLPFLNSGDLNRSGSELVREHFPFVLVEALQEFWLIQQNCNHPAKQDCSLWTAAAKQTDTVSYY